MPTHLENEAALVAQARIGNGGAFATLVNQYDRNIYRLALNITHNRDDAEDVLQEAFLKAYTHLDRFQGNSRFYTWLVRITVNEALMKLRKRRGNRTVSLDEPVSTGDTQFMPQEIEDWRDGPQQRYARTEMQAILNEAIHSLEPQFRIVVVLRAMEELSTKETAELLGLSVPAVKARLLRGRLKLREQLNEYFGRGQANEAVRVSLFFAEA